MLTLRRDRGKPAGRHGTTLEKAARGVVSGAGAVDPPDGEAPEFAGPRELVREAGDIARRMKDSAQQDLAAAGRERRVADGLRALGRSQNAMLDVKA